MTTAAEPDLTTARQPRWDKPGPGSWRLDSSHSGPAPSPIQRGIFEAAFETGFAEGFALFGSPLRSLQMGWVHGKFYMRLVPLVGGGADLPPPPAFVLKIIGRLHPAFRRAERRAGESLRVKRWREEIARWETQWKPGLVATNQLFTTVDPSELDGTALAGHLAELHAHLMRSTTLHFRLHVSDMGPLGYLMVFLEDLGFGRDETFRALVAASPATMAPTARLRDVADAVRAAGVDPAELAGLDDVRLASPEAAAALADYLDTHGWRLTTGYEVEDRCLIEIPEVIVASLRAVSSRPSDSMAAESDRSLAALRAEIPEEHRAEFDELVEDARLSYGLRDQNGPLTYEWPAGLLRRALLEAGARLSEAGHLRSTAEVFELELEEIIAMLRGRGGPGLDEVADRAAERRWWRTLDPPATLGRPEEPPPLGALPPNLGKFTRIVLAVTESLEAGRTRVALEGMGIGAEPYVGTARVVHDASEALASAEPGDIIVAPYTAPTYNAVLAMAGALVTEEGGLLSHAAVIARELGLPAVIGAAEAMKRIPDGATIRVDPATGRVTVLQ